MNSTDPVFSEGPSQASTETLAAKATISFCRTGDFWIDFGLVGLEDYLERHRDELDAAGIRFSGLSKAFPDEFSLEGEPATLSAMLNELKNRLLNEEYLRESGKQWIIRSDEEPYIIPAPVKSLKLYIDDLFGGAYQAMFANLIKTEYDDLSNTEQTVVKKLIQDQPAHFGLKSKKSISEEQLEQCLKKTRIYTNYPTFSINWESDCTPGRRQCDFSGLSFKHTTKALGYHYPLLVDSGKMQSFYSGHRGSYQIGPPYVLAALFAPRNLWYCKVDDGWIYFLPKCDTLDKLRHVMTVMRVRLQAVENPGVCNFDYHKIITSYLHESLLVFLMSVYKSLRSELIANPDEDELAFSECSLVALQPKVSFVEYHTVADLFQLFREMSNIKRTYKDRETGQMITEQLRFDHFVEFVRCFYRSEIKIKKDNHGRTRPRNLLAQRILNLRPIEDVVETYLFEHKASIKNCDELVSTYTLAISQEDLLYG